MKNDHLLIYVKSICKTVDCSLFGVKFTVRVERDNKRPEDGRIFIQLTYRAECNTSHTNKKWYGRKWYLSDRMTEDEIVKTIYAAFEAAVKHEVMENFKINDVVLFNPHVNYKELLKVSGKEIFRA